MADSPKAALTPAQQRALITIGLRPLHTLGDFRYPTLAALERKGLIGLYGPSEPDLATITARGLRVAIKLVKETF